SSQRRDLVLRESVLAQHLGRVLAERGRRPPPRGRPDRRAQLPRPAELEEDAARDVLRMRKHLVELEHRLAADVLAPEARQPLGAGLAGEDGSDLAADPLLHPRPADQLAEIAAPPDGLVEREPELRLERAERQVLAVAGGVDAVAGEAAVQGLRAPRRPRAGRE